ncbi:MAG: helix-turn-helix domain-containing protein, partial [Anaerolineae bacterium]|nr:helix-turn-helix domain-containing protein [Anaerolineae bacterium]
MAVTTPQKPDALENVQAKIERILNEHGPFLSLADAARRANVPLATLSDAVRNKRMKSLRLLGKAYVRLSDVEAYIAHSKTISKKQTWAEMVTELFRSAMRIACRRIFQPT